DFDHADLLDQDDAGRHLNDDIIDLAAVIADQDGSQFHIANVFTVPGEGAMIAGWIPMTPENLSDYAKRCEEAAFESLKKLVASSQARLGLDLFDSDRLKTHIVKGRARADIPALAERVDADLIVMGTVGRVGMPGFLIGNTAESILGAINCSVLALKPEGFETPVKVDD
ncbi:MAG: universal stress protein, partial [Pseudomonadota bacterium]